MPLTALLSSAPDLPQAVIDALPMQLAVVDHDGTILRTNAAWMGFAAENGAPEGTDFVGVNYLHVCRASAHSSEDAAATAAALREVLEGDRAHFVLEYPCHTPRAMRWFELHLTPLEYAEGRGALVAHIDVTARKLAEQRLDQLAHHDELTGLPNVRQLRARLDEAVGTPGTALLLFDLDRFKDVNDTDGHLVGDRVLQAVGAIVHEVALVPGAFCARQGGDEFAMLVPAGTTSTLAGHAEGLRLALRRGLARVATTHAVTASVGATPIVAGETATDAIARADAALYRAKAAGGDRAVVDPATAPE
ncbi:GGDEF domain-containing protein [Patulibacter sp. SYSU D01012]|uniref:sensor domain-containing diguanylate cyclase n=1 Tax=Patulibacter sp. SYSU D01012 TaxID=2817381 RepID=UPI001B3014C7|nr:GGDEF domain-containing protein [Patulibacter sp. SYSU D01012]